MASFPDVTRFSARPRWGGLALAALLALPAPGTALAQNGELPSAMVEAGAAALTGSRGAPQETASKVYSAMFDVSWRPIATAPKNGSDMLLGLWKNGTFLYGLGRWVVNDDIEYPGFWSPMDWFGGEPTVWAPLPPPPPQP